MKDDYAFPRPANHSSAPGMELRDWFAGMALQGYLSAQEGWNDPDKIAAVAYAYADAMLDRRNTQG